MKIDLSSLKVPVVPIGSLSLREPEYTEQIRMNASAGGKVPVLTAVTVQKHNVPDIAGSATDTALGQQSGRSAPTAVQVSLVGGGGGTLIDADGGSLANNVRELLERYGARLDLADLLEQMEERAGIAEYEGELSRGNAEQLALDVARQSIHSFIALHKDEAMENWD